MRAQLADYFDGRRTGFDLPLAMQGTPFQLRVWRALQDIPYGETISYGEQARRIGRPADPRAVGQANGRNPIAVIVPCHRVIGADGSLTGYGGGVERKRQLLELEAGVLSLVIGSYRRPSLRSIRAADLRTSCSTLWAVVAALPGEMPNARALGLFASPARYRR